MNMWNDNILSLYKKYQDSVNISLLIIVPILVFYNSLGNYFFEVDDFNLAHRSNRSITEILITNEYGSNSGGNYRPIEVLSHLVDSNLYGEENPFGRHITNLLLHIVNGIFVYIIGFYLTKNKLIGLTSGLLFTVHIIHSNLFAPVTWIQGRLELLVTLFYLLTIILFIKSLSKGSLLSYFLSLVTFLFALMSKEMAITLPFVILLYIILLPKMQMGKEFFSLRHLSFILSTFLFIGILMLVLGIILNPDFIASHFSSDGMLKQHTIEKIYNSQSILIYGGMCLTLFVVIIYLLLKFSKRGSDFLVQIRYSIPYFFILSLYMIFRFLLLGGMGGAYGSSQGNVIFQIGVDAFMRDVFALATLVWPVGLDYNIDIFKLQIQNPFIFYSISLIVSIALIYIVYKLITSQHRILLFCYSLIFITLMPVHNILIPSWQFQAKYFYLPLVGFCMFIPILLYRLIETKKIPSRFSNALITVFILFIVILSSLSIIKSNEKKAENGEIMRGFVTDMKKYQSKITDATSLYFISFPFTPVSTNSCVYIYAYLDEVLNFSLRKKNFTEYDYNIFSYIKGEDANNFSISWSDERNFSIDGIDPTKYYLIPNKPSIFEEQIIRVYKTIPHAGLLQFHSEGEVKSYSFNIKKNSTAIIRVLRFDEKSSRVKLKIELKEPLNKQISNSLFFNYEKGHFRLVKEY